MSIHYLAKPCLHTLVYYAYLLLVWLPSVFVCYAYTCSLLCVHVYALSLICLPIVYYTYSYLLWLPVVSWSFITCMPIAT